MGQTIRLTVETPLGMLVLEATLGGVPVELGEALPLPLTPLHRAEWTSELARVSLWIGTIDSSLLLDLELLPGQAVEKCYGVLWRVEALRDMVEDERLFFRCRWVNFNPSQTMGPELGASVDAQRWRVGRTEVCVGTSNEVDLAYLGRQQGFTLPERWYDPARPKEPSLLGIEPTQVSERGLEVNYPALLAGEVCHANFSVAWKTVRVGENGEPDEDDLDTWMAADLASVQMARAVSAHLSGE